MNVNRFASIGRDSLENPNNSISRRILNERNTNINLNNDSINFNNNKMKILILFVITIIMSLSNFSIVQDEQMTVLNMFKDKLLKIESQLDENGKINLRNLIEERENNEENENEDNYNSIIDDIIDNFFNISNIIDNITRTEKFYEKDDKDIDIKKKILDYFDKYTFKCDWKSLKDKRFLKYSIGDYTHGKGIFNIKKKSGFAMDNQFIVFTMKNNEGKFIDNWILHSSLSNLYNLEIDINNNSNTFEIIGNLYTTLYKGEFFNIKNEDNPEYCKTNISMFFPLENQTYLNNNYIYLQNFNDEDIKLNLNNFSFIMESSCGFKFLIEANIYQSEIEDKIMIEKINLYCCISTISSIFYLLGIYCIILNIKKYESVLPCISIDCFSINPIWNTYVFLANINLSFKFNLNFHFYSVVIFLCAIKFVYFDFKLLHTYWKKRRNTANTSNFYKQKIRFYILYYTFTFSFFIFINSIFTNFFCIMILCILMWIPQIIYNIKSNNKYGYPFIFILSSTIDKLIYPLYFRGFNNNFLGAKDNLLLIELMILFVIFTIIILYMQVFKDPRFMLSVSNNELKYDFYKNKQELLAFGNNMGKEECVICLLPIIGKENDIMIEMEDKSGIKNIDEEKIDIDDIKEDINSSNNNDTCDSSKDNIIIKEEKPEEEDERQNDIQNLPFIHNDEIELKADNNKIKNYFGNKTKFKLIEEDENNNNSLEEKKFLNKLKIFSIDILFVFKILFCKNFFSFYKKPINSQGKQFMITPCNHIFHTQCLEKWLEYKKECPNCRTSMEEYL